MRDLLVILGDQLDRESSIFKNANPLEDRIWMSEVQQESTHVWSHKSRIAVFFSAMRHFRDELRAGGWIVEYREIDAQQATLAGELTSAVNRLNPRRVRVVQAGDYRVDRALRSAVPSIDVLPDTHFLSSLEDFGVHVKDRKRTVMEYFYREMRRRHDVLMNMVRRCRRRVEL